MCFNPSTFWQNTPATIWLPTCPGSHPWEISFLFTLTAARSHWQLHRICNQKFLTLKFSLLQQFQVSSPLVLLPNTSILVLSTALDLSTFVSFSLLRKDLQPPLLLTSLQKNKSKKSKPKNSWKFLSLSFLLSIQELQKLFLIFLGTQFVSHIYRVQNGDE